jgi:hypothetical protein
MTRILLALLALMSGLVVQAGPVQARINGAAETEIGISEGKGTSARSAQGQSQSIAAPVARKERRERDAQRTRPGRGRVYIPSVLLGIDRAYE